MPALSKTFSMSGYEKRSGNFAIRLLILLTNCVFGRPAEARTSIYMFVPGQSTVIQTGSIAGVHETYGIEGKFRLTVDFDAGIASFDKVDANLTEPTGFLYSQSLGEIFNMTALAGTIVDDMTIQFDDKTDVSLTLTYRTDSAYLTGKTTPEMHTASAFLEVGWDFVDETDNGTEDIWCILEGQDYPRLWWEITKDETVLLAENLPTEQ